MLTRPNGPLFPLQFCREGEQVEVGDLRGGRHFKEKCIEQGLIPGTVFNVIQAGRGGCAVLAINGARVMVGYGMLSRIMVRSAAIRPK